ncbi:MAG: VOC family protein [bacterium]|nr:VOC family protein [bacterium]
MSEDFPLGRFVWHDLMTSDPGAAKDFYTTVVGWGTIPFEGADPPYDMWTNGGAPLGGVAQLPPEALAPPHWLAYVASPDVDATTKQAGDLGGNVMVQPTDIPNVGRFAVIADPQGAVFAAYTPSGEAPGHDGPPNLGEFSWHELATTDYKAALAFYSKLFGWHDAEAMDMGEGVGIYQMYRRTEIPLGGMFNKPAEMPGPPSWLHYARVDDVSRVVEVVKEHGGQVLSGPMEVPGGDFVATCMDPQGAAFAIHHTAGG